MLKEWNDHQAIFTFLYDSIELTVELGCPVGKFYLHTLTHSEREGTRILPGAHSAGNVCILLYLCLNFYSATWFYVTFTAAFKHHRAFKKTILKSVRLLPDTVLIAQSESSLIKAPILKIAWLCYRLKRHFCLQLNCL